MQPPNRILPQEMSQKLHLTFSGKVKPYNHHLFIKNIEKIPYKKAAGGIRPPGLIGLSGDGLRLTSASSVFVNDMAACTAVA